MLHLDSFASWLFLKCGLHIFQSLVLFSPLFSPTESKTLFRPIVLKKTLYLYLVPLQTTTPPKKCPHSFLSFCPLVTISPSLLPATPLYIVTCYSLPVPLCPPPDYLKENKKKIKTIMDANIRVPWYDHGHSNRTQVLEEVGGHGRIPFHFPASPILREYDFSTRNWPTADRHQKQGHVDSRSRSIQHDLVKCTSTVNKRSQGTRGNVCFAQALGTFLIPLFWKGTYTHAPH